MDFPVWLNVPYSEKDEAKFLGARWDSEKRSWYAPRGSELEKFSKWLRPKSFASTHCYAIPPIYLVRSYENCWKCRKETEVHCIAASSFIEHDYLIDDFVTIFKLTSCDNVLADLINRYAPFYKPDYSKQAGSRYYMSHCQWCGSKLGDFYMHNEPEGAFCPVNEVQGMEITLFHLRQFHGPIVVNGDFGMSSPCYISEFAKRVLL